VLVTRALRGYFERKIAGKVVTNGLSQGAADLRKPFHLVSFVG
jgi:hypothetical protein